MHPCICTTHVYTQSFMYTGARANVYVAIGRTRRPTLALSVPIKGKKEKSKKTEGKKTQRELLSY